MLKASNYNIIIECKDSNDAIVFNTLYGSLTIFNPTEFEVVQKILQSPNSIENGSFKKILKDQKYLISVNVDEFSIIEKRKRLGMKDRNRLDVIIMPTLNCNFSCIYCYETKKVGRINSGTQETINKWLLKEIPKFKLVMLHWFGGEPLLDFKSIVNITTHANEVAKKNGIVLIKHITTNGYNLSSEKAKTLIKLGILDFQVTLDGPPETHNKLRPLKSGKETFNKIFNNVILLISLNNSVKVTLRINFNQSNLSEIPRLLNMFPEKYRKQLRVSYEPIFGSCEYNAIDNIPTSDISELLATYYQLANELGYDSMIGHSTIQPGKLVYCYAERENQAIINYNGDVFKCSVYDFESTNRVGYIDNDGMFVKENGKWDKWMNIPLFENQCHSCKYLPLCMGGCRKTRILSKSNECNCALIPTNASYILKQISLNGFDKMVLKESSNFE